MADRERSIERRREWKDQKKRVTSSSSPANVVEVSRKYVYRGRRSSRNERIPKRNDPRLMVSPAKITDYACRSGLHSVCNVHVDGDDQNCDLYEADTIGENLPGLSLTRKKDLSGKVRRKERSILRIQRKCVELERHNRRVEDECQRLNTLLEKRKDAHRRLCARYHKLTLLFQETERTKIDLLTCNQKLETEKARRSEDVMLLKSLIYRLNAELDRCQDKLREYERTSETVLLRESSNLKDDSSHETNVSKESIECAWGRVHFHALGPLLNAYDINLMEKSRLVARYEREMTRVGNRCKEIVGENERMHAEVKELRSKCDRYANETDTLAENVLSLKRRNDTLAKEAEGRQRELVDIQRSYERQIDTITKRNVALDEQHVANTTELNNPRARYGELDKESETLKDSGTAFIPLAVHTAAIAECKRLLEELKREHEAERSKLFSCIKRMDKFPGGSNEQLTTLRAERNHFKALVSVLERKLKRAHRKSEYKRRILYSARISRQSLKNQVSKFATYCEELFSEYEAVVAERERLAALLRETQRENVDFDRIGKSIARRVDILKEQLRLVQSNAERQAARIEQRMKVQKFRVDRIKRKYRGKVCRLGRLVEQKESIIGKLRREMQNQERIVGGNGEERHECKKKEGT